ncbi:MAG TPA: hypothetical protein VH188_01425 [Chthoniobacterales bacterium]|jgi:hypothetical protein|nr:hypothetical protein [Chthoniobacterales bacterium]
MPTKNKKAARPGGSASSNLTLRIPKEMAVPGICRGALTGWPQLLDAMNAVMEDPEFLTSFGQSFASGQPGGPQQLLASLGAGPEGLMKAAPPPDLYGRFVWLAVRVYQAARTFSVTLTHLPVIFKGTPGQIGAVASEVLAGPGGLSTTAGNVAGWAADFLADFPNAGADLDAAQQAHQAAAVALEKQTAACEEKDVVGSIHAHAVATAAVAGMSSRLDVFEASAGKVTAFAVLANMTMAVQSLALAWKVTKEQMETVAQSKREDLGQLSFFQERLGLEEATSEWGGFANTVKSYIQRLLVTR